MHIHALPGVATLNGDGVRCLPGEGIIPGLPGEAGIAEAANPDLPGDGGTPGRPGDGCLPGGGASRNVTEPEPRADGRPTGETLRADIGDSPRALVAPPRADA